MTEPPAYPEFEKTFTESGIGGVTPPVDGGYAPQYKIITGQRIPVSKAYGPLWRRRRDQAASKRKSAEELWDEANRYYENEQSGHRTPRDNDPPVGSEGSGSDTLSLRWSETENIIYAHNSSMLPTLYGQAPQVEFTAEDKNAPQEVAFALAYERLCNVLINMRCAPGLNLHPKLRRGVLSAQLTNYAVAEIDWVVKEQSSDVIQARLQALADRLAAATEEKEIKRVEGELMALEETVDVLDPAGPVVRIVGLKDMYPDPDSIEPDWSDAKWIMKRTFLPTAYIKAVFAVPEYDDDRECKSLYEPTHTLQLGNVGAASGDDPALGWSLFPKESDDRSRVGDPPDKMDYTEVYYVWDKVTRRVSLYNAQQWTWPLWVWDDPKKLDRFYPFYRLWFNDSLSSNYAHAEAVMTLDQQDAINGINSEHKRWRTWAAGSWVYDSNRISEEDAIAITRGADRKPRGVRLEEGMKPTDVLMAVLPPSFQYAALYDKTPVYQAFDRITSTSPALRGQEFKTNTTNEAVQTYNATASTRISEKVDAIENWIADIMWGIVQLANQYMDKNMVYDLIGDVAGQGWSNVSLRDLRTKYAMRIVAGSSQKPTSEFKKREALAVGQVLGQFAQNPVVSAVVTRMFATAFDSVVLTDEDQALIAQSTQPQPAPGGGAPGGGAGDPAMRAKLQQVLSQLSPEQKAQLQEALDAGVPAQEALGQLGVTLQ